MEEELTENKEPNFTLLVLDEETNEYVPCYTAPIANEEKVGDVKLSDAIDGEENAVSGHTAATPLAIKKLNDKIEDIAANQSLGGYKWIVQDDGGISLQWIGLEV